MKIEKIKYCLFILLGLVLLPIKVLAKNELVLSTDQANLKSGDQFTITVNIASDENLYALLATLNYDTNVLELVDNADFTALDNWSDIIYNSNNNKLGVINKSGVVNDKLLSITFKVKDSIEGNKIIISLTNITASDGEKIIDFANAELVLVINGSSSQILPRVNLKATVNNKIDINNNLNSKELNKNNLLIIGMVIGILLIIICKLQNKKGINYLLGFITILTTAFLTSSTANYINKDVNADGIKDYQDAQDIIKYVINFEAKNLNLDFDKNDFDLQVNNDLTNSEDNTFAIDTLVNNDYNVRNYNINGDVNNDGLIDVKDIALVVREVTNKDYIVELQEALKITYTTKDKEINLNFRGQVNIDIPIAKVVINGQEYAVYYDNGIYSVTLPTPIESGNYEYVFSKVILENQKEINVDFKIIIEVSEGKSNLTNFLAFNHNNTFQEQ